MKAGIRNGDVVLTLDGRPFGEYDTDELWNVLDAGEGHQITATYRHREKDQLGDIQSAKADLNSRAFR